MTPGFGLDGNIGGFAQAADDTRAVIDFMHSNPLPLGYETPVPCDAIPGDDAIYDVSISDVVRPAGTHANGGRLGGQGIHRDRR